MVDRALRDDQCVDSPVPGHPVGAPCETGVVFGSQPPQLCRNCGVGGIFANQEHPLRTSIAQEDGQVVLGRVVATVVVFGINHVVGY